MSPSLLQTFVETLQNKRGVVTLKRRSIKERMSEKGNSEAIYIIYIAGKEHIRSLPDDFDSYFLSTNLFLVKSKSTQSRLYHDIKKTIGPVQLFVGKLKENPKFKGMAEGALKWVREGSS